MLTFCPSSPTKANFLLPVVLQRFARRLIERETLARHYRVVREVLRAAHGRRAAAVDENRAPLPGRPWNPEGHPAPPTEKIQPFVVVVLVMLPDAAAKPPCPAPAP